MQHAIKHRPAFSGRIASATMISLALGYGATAAADGYVQSNLVTDDQAFLTGLGYTPALTVDPNLVNPWGLAHLPGSPIWTSNNGTNSSTLYTGQGVKLGLTVAVTGAPTGQVADNSHFHLSSQAQNSLFIFAGENGTISEWNTGGSLTNANVAVDNSAKGAVYKGLAEATVGGAHQLYATDFHNNRIDVFDANYGSVLPPSGAFTDLSLPKGYAPFGIQNVNGDLFVTYARQDAQQHDDRAGPGNGVVDVFHPDGTFVARVASRGGVLNSPWAVAMAPANFGEFSGDLLVGNFGDGLINVFDPHTYAYIAHLSDQNGDAIQIDGLWGLMFGGGVSGGIPNGLYFSAGIGDEAHGLLGVLTPAPVPVPTMLPMLGMACAWLGARGRRRAPSAA